MSDLLLSAHNDSNVLIGCEQVLTLLIACVTPCSTVPTTVTIITSPRLQSVSSTVIRHLLSRYQCVVTNKVVVGEAEDTVCPPSDIYMLLISAQCALSPTQLAHISERITGIVLLCILSYPIGEFMSSGCKESDTIRSGQLDSFLKERTIVSICDSSDVKCVVCCSSVLKKTKQWERISLLVPVFEPIFQQRMSVDFSCCVPPVTALSPFAKMVVTAEKPAAIDNLHSAVAAAFPAPVDIRVWTQPSRLSAMPYMLTLLRLCGCCPVLYLDKVAAHFRLDLINGLCTTGSQRLRRELLRVLCQVLENAICLFRTSAEKWATWFRRLTSDICRVISMIKLCCTKSYVEEIIVLRELSVSVSTSDIVLSSERLAYLVAKFASQQCPHDTELVAATARCATICGEFDLATELYRSILSIDAGNTEAVRYLTRVANAPASVATIIQSSNRSKCKSDYEVSIASSYETNRFHPARRPSGKSSMLRSTYLDEDPNWQANGGCSGCMIEKEVPLSMSAIWLLQRNYYRQRGLDAWRLGVSTGDATTMPIDENEGDGAKVHTPFYGTSNLSIANDYARFIFLSILDGLQRDTISVEAPIYIIELGAGHAVLSARLAINLQSLFPRILPDDYNDSLYFKLARVKIVLVITDVDDGNINAMLSDPSHRLSEYAVKEPFANVNDMNINADLKCERRNVWVDCGAFDAEISGHVTLRRANIRLSSEGCGRSQNQIFTVANYLFDSLCTDALFLHADGSLSEGLSTLMREPEMSSGKDRSCTYEEMLGSLTSTDLHQCRQVWNYAPVLVSDYYSNRTVHDARVTSEENAFLDKVLQNLVAKLSPYAENISYDKNASAQGLYFSFPVGAIACLHRLQRWSGRDEIVLLAADKAVNSIDAMIELSYPPVISLHGSLSVTVNFIAISACFAVMNELLNPANSSDSSIPMRDDALVWQTPQQLCDVDIMVSAALHIPIYSPHAAEVLPLLHWAFTSTAAYLNNSDIRNVLQGIEDAYGLADKEKTKIDKRQKAAEREESSFIDVPDQYHGGRRLPASIIEALTVYSAYDEDVAGMFLPPN